jgi:hypothetical protein
LQFLDNSVDCSNLELERKVSPVPVGKTTAVLVIADDQVMTADNLPEVAKASILPL